MEKTTLKLPETDAPIMHFGVTQRSNRLINYFLGGYFLLGLAFASFYDTWVVGFGFGGLLLAVYYSAKAALPKSCLYQYVLSVVLGLYMAQFIYQMHGMIEMHFFAFIGSALLITYQNWKLQLPMLILVLLHHALLGHLQDTGKNQVYFSLNYFDLQTFFIHILLTIVIYLICGLCAFQLHKYHLIEVEQTKQLDLLQEAARLSMIRQKNMEAMEERNIILESIGDAFFAVDRNWTVTYWNQTAAKVLYKTKKEMLNHNLWSVFTSSVDSTSYQKYHEAVLTKQAVHFEDYFKPLDKWYEISAYPSANGLSVYFKDITERLQYIKAIEQQNEKLQAISWMQSHVIRAPLARIMGLIPIFIDPEATVKERVDLSKYLVLSANELDKVIKNISDLTYEAAVK